MVPWGSGCPSLPCHPIAARGAHPPQYSWSQILVNFRVGLKGSTSRAAPLGTYLGVYAGLESSFPPLWSAEKAVSLLSGSRISGAAQQGCHQAHPLPPSPFGLTVVMVMMVTEGTAALLSTKSKKSGSHPPREVPKTL